MVTAWLDPVIVFVRPFKAAANARSELDIRRGNPLQVVANVAAIEPGKQGRKAPPCGNEKPRRSGA
ncbi:hypothetical protein EDM76_14030 [bacterium]|nr:MAG: hypothetical protein EDM76_14030 [bacterium]